jgi:thiol-disulfide isomerase/thioredoxin
MRRFSTSGIALKVLGLLLLTAAVLKGHELLTVPVANKDLWSWRPFMILQVEFELALGIWLLSGIFKRSAWLAALTCFSLFCCITLYKGLSGAASCGCFGRVHVNPWITLTAIDLPAVISLCLFRPAGLSRPPLSLLQGRKSIRNTVRYLLAPLPSPPRFAVTAALGVATLSLTAPILAVNKPPSVTSTYAVLEPETWAGKALPILESIDIAARLEKDRWLVVLYHHDCPDCQKILPEYERMAEDLAGNEDFLRVALVELAPYGEPPGGLPLRHTRGQLSDAKEWLVTTPCVLLLAEGRVLQVWRDELPDFASVLKNLR